MGKNLRGIRLMLLAAGIAGAMTAAGQAASGPAVPKDISQDPVLTAKDIQDLPLDPVAQVRNNQSWEYGPFVNWGTGLGNRDTYKFFWGGFELGKVLTPVVHAGIFSGQFEFAGNIMPLWQAYTPPPHNEVITCTNPPSNTCEYPFGGGTFYGVSLTPVIFRWNFLTSSHRIQPWFQAAGGLIYTTHKYPPNYMSDPNSIPPIDGGTSVWNFAPQGGAGVHYFMRPKRSIDLGVNAVHISSASLGDRNPGVNASVQIQVGYTFWR